jgi:hypothetical protein
MRSARIDMGPDGVEAIRRAKTTDLLAMLNPEVACEAIGGQALAAGTDVVDPDSLRAFMEAVATEINRRIPVPV